MLSEKYTEVEERVLPHEPQRLRLQFVIFPLAMTFLAPVFSVLSALALVFFGGVNTRLPKALFWPILAMVLTSFLAFFSAYNSSSSSAEMLESSKFLFMAIVFWVGFSSGLQTTNVRKIVGLLSSIILLWYVFQIAFGISIPYLYPPDFNNSAILFVFFAFILSEGRNLLARLLIIVLLYIFSEIAQSRIILIFSPIFFVTQPVSLSILRLLALTFAIGGALYIMFITGRFGSFSDLVRLEIYSSSIEIIYQQGFSIFGPGPQNFVNMLNDTLPPFISNRLDVSHAHNAFLEISGSYGLGAAFFFSAFFIGLLNFSISYKDDTLRNQIIVLLALMMIEAVISDSRVLFCILLIMGMQAGQAFERGKLRPMKANYIPTAD